MRSSTPSDQDPPAAFRWLRGHPVVFALVVAGAMVALGLFLFDGREAAALGAVASAVFTYLAWRPGGFGWRLDRQQRALLEERGDLGVRSTWLWRIVLSLAGLAVLALVIVSATS